MLKNPAYAGAYAFGRYTSRRTVDPDGTVHTTIVERPRPESAVLIKDHHEGYITWADFLANEARLAANHTAAGARPAREGTALCQGIIVCGSCGKPMMTNYHTGQRPAYACSSRRDRLTTPTCRTVAAACVDEAVAGALLAALTPEQVALALSAAGEVAGGISASAGPPGWQLNGPATRLTGPSAPSTQVEPENRLVTRSLEARWEAKLTALAEAEQALAAAQDTLPPLPGRAELEKLAGDLPVLWHAGTTSARDRKRLLRTLIADVTMLPEPDRSKVRIGIRWHTGAVDELTADRPLPPGPARRSPSPAVEIIRRLGPTTDTRDLAGRLNAAGLTTGHGKPFDMAAVQWIRHAYKIPAPNPYDPGELSVAQAASRRAAAQASSTTGSRQNRSPPAAVPGNRLCIPWTSQIEADCQARIAQSGHLTPAARRTSPRQGR